MKLELTENEINILIQSTLSRIRQIYFLLQDINNKDVIKKYYIEQEVLISLRNRLQSL
jgi:hypothetical protein